MLNEGQERKMVLLGVAKTDIRKMGVIDAKAALKTFGLKTTKESKYEKGYLFFEQTDIEQLEDDGYTADSSSKLSEDITLIFYVKDGAENEMTKKEIIELLRGGSKSSRSVKSPRTVKSPRVTKTTRSVKSPRKSPRRKD